MEIYKVTPMAEHDFYSPVEISRSRDLTGTGLINQDCSVGHSTDRIPRLRPRVVKIQLKSGLALPGRNVHSQVQGSRTEKPFHQLEGLDQWPSKCGSSDPQEQHHWGFVRKAHYRVLPQTYCVSLLGLP